MPTFCGVDRVQGVCAARSCACVFGSSTSMHDNCYGLDASDLSESFAKGSLFLFAGREQNNEQAKKSSSAF